MRNFNLNAIDKPLAIVGQREKMFHSESEKPFQSCVYLTMILVIDRLICHCFVNLQRGK